MDARIRIFLRIIEEYEGILGTTSNEIARLLGLGKPHLLRLFRKEMGKTLRRHMLEARMTRAARLVKNVSLPIKNISSQCGYTLLSNFCRDFKDVHGVTPVQMRFRYMNIQLRDNMPELIKLSLSNLDVSCHGQIDSPEVVPNRHKRTA